MLYAISFMIYVVVFGIGFYLVRMKTPHMEKLLGRICFMGLILQILVNYLFWGRASSFNPLAVVISPERSAVNLMLLALVAIFCYASLLVVLYKANDFYNE